MRMKCFLSTHSIVFRQSSKWPNRPCNLNTQWCQTMDNSRNDNLFPTTKRLRCTRNDTNAEWQCCMRSMQTDSQLPAIAICSKVMERSEKLQSLLRVKTIANLNYVYLSTKWRRRSPRKFKPWIVLSCNNISISSLNECRLRTWMEILFYKYSSSLAPRKRCK